MTPQEQLATITKIIVHPGRAHFDDFMSVALATQFVQVRLGDRVVLEIERRVPTSEELDDEKVLIFDVGGKHEPEKLNFDHHTLEGPTCSFQLFLEWLGIWDEFKIIHPWADRAAFMDHFGPSRWAEANGIDKKIMCKMVSPVEDAMVYSFYDDPNSYFMLLTLEAVGKYCIELMTKVRECIEDIERCHDTFITKRGVLGFVYTGEIKPRIFPAAAYILAKKYGWAISITPDDRGAGWSLYRFHEDSGIDFTRIKDHPDVTFTHFSGFLAKVREGSDFVELIDESVM